MRHVLLDSESTTPVLPEVIEAMQSFARETSGKTSSPHPRGPEAQRAMAKAREQIAALVQAESPEDILFTSGGGEATKLAVTGTAVASHGRGNHIVVSAIEHPAVLAAVASLEQQGFTATRVGVDAQGFVAPDAVRAALTDKTILICLHHVNHEIGTIEPVREVGQLAAERGLPMFVDATASGGWLPIDVQAMGASLLALSPRRFCGPEGVGVLYRHQRAPLAGLLPGGEQDGSRRAGTESVPAMVGAGTAAEIAARELPERIAHTARLQKQLWAGLHSRVPFLRLNGPEPGPRRISTSLSFCVEFVDGEDLRRVLGAHGIAVASEAIGVGKARQISHVLTAIGLDETLARCRLMLSLGKANTVEEMDYVAETFERIVGELRQRSPLWDDFQRGAVLLAPGTNAPAGPSATT
jgi:cysteine desulfurase